MALVTTDLGFADDLALLSDTIDQAKELLLALEIEVIRRLFLKSMPRKQIICASTNQQMYHSKP